MQLTLRRKAEWHVSYQVLVCGIWSPLVRQDPRHSSVGSSPDELLLSVCWREAAQRDHQGILAREGFCDCRRRVIVDVLDLDACWQLGLAVGTGDGRDGMLACLEEGFSYVTATIAASLGVSVSFLKPCTKSWRTPTIATFLI